MATKFPLVESFGPTIQGEGAVIGTQTTFLRLGGCDYKCTRCDSLHAVLPEIFSQDGTTQYMEMEELIEHALTISKNTPWVTISGGNPCMWDISELVDALNRAGKIISVETQGTLWQDWLLDCAAVTLSPKGPGMGVEFEPDKFQVFMDHLEAGDFEGYVSAKIVVFDQQDLEFIIGVQERWPILKPHMFVSIGNWQPPAPAIRHHTEEDTYEKFVMSVLESTRMISEEILKDPRLQNARILPQLHTLIWGNGQGF